MAEELGSDLGSSGEELLLTISQDSFQGIGGQNMKCHQYTILEYLMRPRTN